MQLGLGFWGSRTLLSAVELGLFTELAKGPMTAAQVQSRLGLHPRSGADCQAWMRDIGFSRTRVEHLAGPDSMVIGVK